MLRHHVSISLCLTLWFGSVFFIGWVLFGAAMWLNLKRTLTREREFTLARRVDRLQELLRKNQAEDAADRYQIFEDFAHATGNGLAEIYLSDGSQAYRSPSAEPQFSPGQPLIKIDKSGSCTSTA